MEEVTREEIRGTKEKKEGTRTTSSRDKEDEREVRKGLESKKITSEERKYQLRLGKNTYLF